MTEPAALAEEMLDAGEVAYDECEAADCTKRQTVAAIFFAMQAVREMREQAEAVFH